MRLLLLAWFLCLMAFIPASQGQNCNFTISLPQDFTICEPGTVDINGMINGEFFSYEWTGTNGFSNNTTLDPSIEITETTTLTLSVLGVPGSNQIINGNFSSGNSGFTTDYTFVPDIPGNQGEMYPEGTYTIVTNPNLVHNGFSACSDHTGGGNMMVVNGASSLQEVWCQNVTVNPNSHYIFQAFATSVNPASPAILQFSINGLLLGSPFNLSGTVCEWEEFYTVWDSGSNTSVQICITNQNTAAGGNDFAIDDVFFSEFCNDEEEISIFLQEFDAEISPPPLLTCSQPEGTIIVTPLPFSQNYTYMWDTPNGYITTPPTNQSVNVITAGQYLVTVTDEAGCTRTAAVEVEEDKAAPYIAVSGNTLLSCTMESTTLFAASDLDAGPFIWTRPDLSTSIGPSLNVTQPGFYDVTTTGANGCTGTASLEVIFEPPSYVYQDGQSGPLSCSNKEAWAWVNISSEFDSIQWQGPGISDLSADNDSVQVNKPGMYYYTFFLGSQCWQTDSILVTEIPAQINYTITTGIPITCLQPETEAFVTPLHQVSTWQWTFHGNVIAGKDTLRANIPGLYVLEIIDLQGCRKTDTILIKGDLTLPDVEIKTDTIDCITNAGGFHVFGESDYTYTWTGPDGKTSQSSNPVFTAEGIYTLKVTAGNGCISVDTIPLPSSKEYPELTVYADTITCNHPAASIHIENPSQSVITWQGPLSQSGSTANINTSIPGLYTIQATSSNGCTSAKEVVVNIDTLQPQLELSPSFTLNCQIESVIPNVQASDFVSFLWQYPNGSAQNTSLEPQWNLPGTYSLTLTNANGCKTSKTCVVKQDTGAPVFNAKAQDLTCDHPESELVVSGPSGLQYFDSSGMEIISPYLVREAGTYTIRAIGPNGCDSTISLEVLAFQDPPKVEIDTVYLNCNKQTCFVKDNLFNELLSYTWHIDNQTKLADSIEIKKGQKVELIVSDLYGCETIIAIPVIEDFVQPAVAISGPEIISCHESSTTLSIETPAADFQYRWQGAGIDGKTTTFVTITEGGNYTLYVTNPTNGCINVTEKLVSKMDSPTIGELQVKQPRCYGDKGIVSLSVPIGGTAPYRWTLNNLPAFEGQQIPVNPGEIMIQVIDANNCTADTLLLFESPSDFSVHAGNDTLISYSDRIVLSGATSLEENSISKVQWQPESLFNCPSCLQPEATPESDVKCSLIVTDLNGCTHTDEVWIRVRFDKGIIAPNIFSPESGSGNQRFTIYSFKNTVDLIKKLMVYDRWGNLVFQSENIEAGKPDLGWDGVRNGTMAIPGVYSWVALIAYKDQTTEWVKGDVTLLR